MAEGVVYVLGVGTNQPLDDGPLFDEIASRFDLLVLDRP